VAENLHAAVQSDVIRIHHSAQHDLKVRFVRMLRQPNLRAAAQHGGAGDRRSENAVPHIGLLRELIPHPPRYQTF
jgi:hypothetical protein